MDIRDYLKRMNYQGPLEPTLQTLQALHEAHLLAVPSENLSIHAGQPIILREDALYAKIVHRGRGGFCYELNGLFAWLLHQLGFQVTLLSAGVANGAGNFGPAFDHLTLLIHQLDGADWLADPLWPPLRIFCACNENTGRLKIGSTIGGMSRCVKIGVKFAKGPLPVFWRS